MNAANPTTVPIHYESLQRGLISYHFLAVPEKAQRWIFGTFQYLPVLSNILIPYDKVSSSKMSDTKIIEIDSMVTF